MVNTSWHNVNYYKGKIGMRYVWYKMKIHTSVSGDLSTLWYKNGSLLNIIEKMLQEMRQMKCIHDCKRGIAMRER